MGISVMLFIFAFFFRNVYFLLIKNKDLSQDLHALHRFINLYLWYRTGF